MSIFSSDDRIQVTPPNDYPFSAVGRMRMRWKGADGVLGTSDDIERTASGAMIDSYHFLTAGHCVFEFKEKLGWADSIEVILGSGGNRISYGTTYRADNESYGEAQSVYMRSYKEWTDQGNFNYDLGLVTLDRNIGTFTGTFGYGYDDNLGNGTLMNVAGYPTDKFDSNGDKYWDNYNMWRQSGKITSTTDLTLRSTELDIIPGNSGGPMWLYDTNKKARTIYGVVSNETSNNNGQPLYNEFTRITRSRYEDIQRWIQEDNAARRPVDKADLVDYDNWFSTQVSSVSKSELYSGETLRLRTVVRNNGTATANNFTISFYASKDADLSTGYDNYFVGKTTVSALSPFQWQDAIWEGAFPSLDRGYYYIGWWIDSETKVTEFNESNNIGLIKNASLYAKANLNSVNLSASVQNGPGETVQTTIADSLAINKASLARIQLDGIDRSTQGFRRPSLGQQYAPLSDPMGSTF